MFNGLANFIYKSFGFDVDIYNKFANRSDQYIFKTKSKWYLFFKFGTFSMIFMSAAVFIYLYCVVKYSDFLLYPYVNENGGVEYSNGIKGMQDLEGRVWIFLVFAVLYCFSAVRLWNLLWSLRKKNEVQRANILYSFNYIFFLTAAIIVVFRFSLYFSVDNMQLFLNFNVFKDTILFNKGHEKNVVMIYVGYCWVIIVTILNFLFILVCFIIKPKLKEDIKIKMNEAQKQYVTIMQNTMNQDINVSVYLPKSLLPINENGNITLSSGEELDLSAIVKNDPNNSNNKIIEITNLKNENSSLLISQDKTNKNNLIKPDEQYWNSVKKVLNNVKQHTTKLNTINSFKNKNKIPSVIKIVDSNNKQSEKK